MNDADLRQLLTDAEQAAPPAAPWQAPDLARRVCDRQRRGAARRRRVAITAAFALAGVAAVPFVVNRSDSFVAAPPQTPLSAVRPTTGVARWVATDQPDVSTARLDKQLAEIEQRIAALERGNRLAQLSGRRMAVRDPLADANERRATALLDAPRPSDGSAGPDTGRRRVLELVVQLYPQTVAAAVARQEIKKIGTEKRT